MLHVSVRRIGETFLLLARRIQTDEVTRNILHFVLRPLFEPLPSTRTQPCDGRFGTFTAFVLADTVEVMNRDEHVSAVAVVEFDHLLRLAVNRCSDESAELGDTVVGMNHIIAYLELVYLTQGDDCFAATRVLATHRHTVVTLENLMVGIAANLQSPVHESLMQRGVDAGERDRRFADRLKDSRKSVELFLLLGKDINRVALFDMLAQVVREQVELLVEHRLRHDIKGYLRVLDKRALVRHLDGTPVRQSAACELEAVPFEGYQRPVIGHPYIIIRQIVHNTLSSVSATFCQSAGRSVSGAVCQ